MYWKIIGLIAALSLLTQAGVMVFAGLEIRKWREQYVEALHKLWKLDRE